MDTLHRDICGSHGVGEAATVKPSDLRIVSKLIKPAQRPLSYWLENHPPGWVSQYSATNVDPVLLACKIVRLSFAFCDWLDLPDAERWDTFTLQAFSAALFNRFRKRTDAAVHRPAQPGIGLLQLDWPAKTEDIRLYISQLQRMTAAPFAVYKAVRSAVDVDSFPTAAEVHCANTMLEAGAAELRCAGRQLHAAIHLFAGAESKRTERGRADAGA